MWDPEEAHRLVNKSLTFIFVRIQFHSLQTLNTCFSAYIFILRSQVFPVLQVFKQYLFMLLPEDGKYQ